MTQIEENTILFDLSKNESMSPTNGLKNLTKKLKDSWKIECNNKLITSAILQNVKLFVIPGPREMFTNDEFEAMKKYINNNGNILIALGEGGESAFQTNINFFLEEYGVVINNDSVIRSNYYKYFDPKETLIVDGILNRSLCQNNGDPLQRKIEEDDNFSRMEFIYPYGASLSVQKPSIALLSTGLVSVPLSRPICSYYEKYSKGGKIVVIGSSHVFNDKYLYSEDNEKLIGSIFTMLIDKNTKLNKIDKDNFELNDFANIPSISDLADNVKSCLQDSDDFFVDISSIFDSNLYWIGTEMVPSVQKTYKQLKIEDQQLSLIKPHFECPLPNLQFCAFEPRFRSLDPPSLELFDLDEEFYTNKSKLALIANKCSDDDLEYYVCECSNVLMEETEQVLSKDGKKLLNYFFNLIVEFKKNF